MTRRRKLLIEEGRVVYPVRVCEKILRFNESLVELLGHVELLALRSTRVRFEKKRALDMVRARRLIGGTIFTHRSQNSLLSSAGRRSSPDTFRRYCREKIVLHPSRERHRLSVLNEADRANSRPRGREAGQFPGEARRIPHFKTVRDRADPAPGSAIQGENVRPAGRGCVQRLMVFCFAARG